MWDSNTTTTLFPSALSAAGIRSTPVQTKDFLLDFIPDKSLAVVVQQKGNLVTVLDFKSSVPWLTIEASMEVCGIRVIKNTIVAIGQKKVIAWNLPGKSPLPGTRLSIQDSTKTIEIIPRPKEDTQDNKLHSSSDTSTKKVKEDIAVAASISLDFCYIAFLMDNGGVGVGDLCLWNAPTGQYICHTQISLKAIPWFVPSGNNLWCILGGGKAEVWEIVDGKLKRGMSVYDIEHGPLGYPWVSSCGYQVMNDGSVFGLGKRKLLMVPPAWQLDVVQRVWNGNFLVLLNARTPKPIIIEFKL